MPLFPLDQRNVLRLLRTGGFEAILTSYTENEGQHLYVYDKISKNLIQSYVIRIHRVPMASFKEGRFNIYPYKQIHDIRGGTGKYHGGRFVLTGRLERILSTQWAC